MTKNRINVILSFLLFMLLAFDNSMAQSIPLRLKDGAGTLRIGIINNGKSCWIDECRITQKGNCYTIKSESWKSGELNITVLPLADTNGIIIELSGKKMPQGTEILWAFGGCSGKESKIKDNKIHEADCKDNVFCTEGNSFTTYYGEVMKLKTVNGVMPWGEEMHLKDAYCQKSPIELNSSDKKSDATVISSIIKLEDTPLYLCIFQQNAKADYNYSMLKNLFLRTKNGK